VKEVRMPGSRPHYKLEAWKEAVSLVSMVYKISQDFPKNEIYGLSAQLR
jgi:hypothetical protein